MSATTLRRLIILALIALWEILPRSGLIPELFLPTLSSTLIAGWNEAAEYGHAEPPSPGWHPSANGGEPAMIFNTSI